MLLIEETAGAGDWNLAAKDIEQSESWACGLPGTALQLRDIAGAQVKSPGEGGLAHVGALPLAANFFALNRLEPGKRLLYGAGGD